MPQAGKFRLFEEMLGLSKTQRAPKLLVVRPKAKEIRLALEALCAIAEDLLSPSMKPTVLQLFHFIGLTSTDIVQLDAATMLNEGTDTPQRPKQD